MERDTALKEPINQFEPLSFQQPLSEKKKSIIKHKCAERVMSENQFSNIPLANRIYTRKIEQQKLIAFQPNCIK